MKQNEGMFKTIILVMVTAAVVFVVTSSYYINNMASTKNQYGYIGEYVNASETGGNTSGDFSKLKKVLALIERDFLFDDYTMEQVEEGAINGMLYSLGDPYTSYFNKAETESFLTETIGNYEGVGMYITYGSQIQWPMVISLVKDSPAEEAGIQAGDYIYSVSGEELEYDTSLEEVASKLKGKAGTEVQVTLIRIDEDKKQTKYTVELERRKIELASIEHKVIEDDIGYIKFSSFDEGIGTKFKNAYQELVDDKQVKGVIIDLRDNPGGLINEVIKIADELVPEGIITYTIDKNERRKVEYSDANQTSVPLVILINENSASASEILSAAIKDYGVGKIVGKTSYGKGLVQEFVNLKDGTYIKVTMAEYFSPKGNKINKIGVTPDVEIENNKETKEDEQLNKAIEVMKNEI